MITSLPAQLFAQEAVTSLMPVQKIDQLNTEITTSAGVEVNQSVVFTEDGFEAEFKVVSKWQGAFNSVVIYTSYVKLYDELQNEIPVCNARFPANSFFVNEILTL
jgi:hypothetical protein